MDLWARRLTSALVSVLFQASIKGATKDPCHGPCVVISSAKTNIFSGYVYRTLSCFLGQPWLALSCLPSLHLDLHLWGQLFICCSLLPWVSNSSVFLLLAFICGALLKLNS